MYTCSLYVHALMWWLKRVKTVIPHLWGLNKLKLSFVSGHPFISCWGDVGPPAALAFDVPLLTLVTFQAEDTHRWEDIPYLGRCQRPAWLLNQVLVVPESGLESGSVLQSRWPFHMAAPPSSHRAPPKTRKKRARERKSNQDVEKQMCI